MAFRAITGELFNRTIAVLLRAVADNLVTMWEGSSAEWPEMTGCVPARKEFMIVRGFQKGNNH